MRDIFELEKNTVVLSDSSYLNSYPYIKSYFERIETITAENIILGSHMVYGWMPTILDLYLGDKNPSLDEVVKICNKAKLKTLLSKNQLEGLASVVNNSLVGASKLLHFINPEVYPIWDSKIYTFIHENKPYNYRVNDSGLYFSYIKKLEEIQNDERFEKYHQNVNNKIGYEVTPIRAIELVMFLNAP